MAQEDKKPPVLTDGEIRLAKAEAERLSWTHKAHPAYEKDKYLLEAQRDDTFQKTMKQIRKWLINHQRVNKESGLLFYIPLEEWGEFEKLAKEAK